MPEIDTLQLQALLPRVVDIARHAGDFILQERDKFNYSQVEIKGRNDLVSYVDKTAEREIVDALRTLLPQAGFIAEEQTATTQQAYNWIIDPLDGTTNFVHGIPCYAVSIALAHGNDVLLGSVHEVNRAETFYAAKGGGAYLNGQAVRVSDRRHLSESLIATGFPIYNFTRLEPYLSTLQHLMQHTHGLRRIGAASVDLCYVACGRMDAFFEYNLQPWDVAAGGLIVQEAGGCVQDFGGGNNWLFGRELSCTNGHLQAEFQRVIDEHGLAQPHQ